MDTPNPLLLFIKLLSCSARKALPILCGFFLLQSVDVVRAETGTEPWRVVGSGEFRVLLFSIYHATLESPVADFHFPDATPLRLTLRYERAIKPEQIVVATREQWQLQKIPFKESWLTHLQTCIPALVKGDRLGFYIKNDAAAELQFNDRVICSFDDRDFIQSFIGIWLSERSTAPLLRAALLGKKK